ncbi:MAG TPA: sugar-binding protein [Pirellulaceae bacterium]|nr:sugar-binding protein [Pirellulaceae bacterium]
MSARIGVCFASIILILAQSRPAPAQSLQPGVRGLATRAPAGMKIDGDLSEFKGAFCTPVNYFVPAAQVKERPAQFFYMWDDTAFYAALRTLDTKTFNGSDDAHLWGGDAVEWYFDTRREGDFRGIDWGKGAVHMYWTGFDKAELKPRWCLRPGYLDAIPGKGVEVGAKKTEFGTDVEFKLPWENFPNFKAKLGEVIALDAELCYSDGAARVDRIFAYGSPLCVQQPAAQGQVQLVEKLEPAHWKQCGAVLAPMRCDTPWTQRTKALVTGQVALPPDHADQVGKIVFRVSDLEGKALGEYPAQRRTLHEAGRFYLAEAQWPSDVAVPGLHTVVAVLHGSGGQELCRVAPRLVSAGWVQGY